MENRSLSLFPFSAATCAPQSRQSSLPKNHRARLSTRDARVRVEMIPGERFVHMIETFFGLARLGHTDRKGMLYPMQLALTALEFSDVIVFRSPPLAVQRAIFGALAPIARWRGYRAMYPQLSRIVLAPQM
jgi:hypothetical protein